MPILDITSIPLGGIPAELVLAPLGLLIGLAMGSVGGGGSLVAIPILVYLADQSAREAQGTALVIVIAAATIGVISYLRDNDVRWRAGLAFGIAAGFSSFAGSLLSRELDPDLLLLIFSPVMVVGAWALLSDKARSVDGFRPWRLGFHDVAKVILYGLAVGWLIGLFGVGGGFVIVPVLVLGLGFKLTEAIGTSLFVIIIGSVVALGDRIQAGDIDWAIALPFSLAAAVGVLIGTRVAERVPADELRRGFAGVVILAAIYTAIDSSLAIL